GLGAMGSGICSTLIAKGKNATVYDINQDVLESFKGTATIATCPNEVLQNSDCIFLSLPSSNEVEPLVESFLTEGVKGKTIVDLSTSYPFSTMKLNKLIEENGGVYVDAALSGSPADCKTGKIMVLFGGDKIHFDRLKPTMECFCGKYKYVGKSGSGHLAKLMMNFIGLSYVSLYAQTFPLTEKMGLDNNILRELISESGLGCGTFQFYAPKLLSKTYDLAFAMELAHKDLTYVRQLFEEYQAPAFSLDGTLNLMRTGLKEGRGKKDVSEICAVIHEFLESR
ncbi:MAG: NAD(P)-dependent oxidoreductase, partial [Verrucomicrobiae bacterium]|nr:NAD(P)-dependent oxidoreductase [Verrucomicrobiae bacterium]